MIETIVIMGLIILIETWILFKVMKKTKTKEKNLDRIIVHAKDDTKAVKIKEQITKKIIEAKEPEDVEKIVTNIRDIYNTMEL